MPSTTYNLFFTGRDDPRHWVIIGEDTKPVLLCFETPETPGMSSVKTTLFLPLFSRYTGIRGTWWPLWSGPRVTIWDVRQSVAVICRWHNSSLPILLPSKSLFHVPRSESFALRYPSGRWFTSADGQRYEWRPSQTSYNLYAPGNRHIAIYTLQPQATPVGPAHGILQYTFNHELLLVESLLALSLNRWIDLHGM